MKLSSLNKFKNKVVLVNYMDSDMKHDPRWDGALSECVGILEEVDESFITIAEEDSLTRIKISDIRMIWDKEKTKEIEKRKDAEREAAVKKTAKAIQKHQPKYEAIK